LLFYHLTLTSNKAVYTSTTTGYCCCHVVVTFRRGYHVHCLHKP